MLLLNFFIFLLFFILSICVSFKYGYYFVSNDKIKTSFKYFSTIKLKDDIWVRGSLNIGSRLGFQSLFNFIEDENPKIYVGARDGFYELEHDLNILRNFINISSFFSLKKYEDKNHEILKKNYVLSIFKSSQEDLLVCTSGGGSPQLFRFQIKSKDTSLISSSIFDNTFRSNFSFACPSYPYIQYGSLLFKEANQVSIISGLPSNGLISQRILITRMNSNFQPIKYLTSAPTSEQDQVTVGVFEKDEFVFVVSNEVIFSENTFLRKSYRFPWLTRICKNDHGNFRSKHFASSVRISLVCQQNEKKLEFLKIVSFYYDKDESFLHGLFSTPDNLGSAICVFKLNYLINLMSTSEGILVKQTSSGDKIVWESNTYNINKFSKVLLCQENASESFEAIHTVTIQGKQNFFFHPVSFDDQRSFRKIVAEKITFSSDLCYIYWLYDAQNPGHLMRVIANLVDGKTISYPLNQVLLPFAYNSPSALWDLKLVKYKSLVSIYAVTDERVFKMSNKMCHYYTKCTLCVADPHCDWNGEICLIAKNNLHSKNFMKSPLLFCSNFCSDKREKKFFLVSGMSLNLSCFSLFCNPDPNSFPIWFFNEKPLFNYTKNNPTFNTYVNEFDENVFIDSIFEWKNKEENLKQIFVADDFSLQITKLSKKNHQGKYSCIDFKTKETIASYQVSISEFCEYGDSLETTWKEEYVKWCNMFDQYKNRLSNLESCPPKS